MSRASYGEYGSLTLCFATTDCETLGIVYDSSAGRQPANRADVGAIGRGRERPTNCLSGGYEGKDHLIRGPEDDHHRNPIHPSASQDCPASRNPQIGTSPTTIGSLQRRAYEPVSDCVHIVCVSTSCCPPRPFGTVCATRSTSRQRRRGLGGQRNRQRRKLLDPRRSRNRSWRRSCQSSRGGYLSHAFDCEAPSGEGPNSKDSLHAILFQLDKNDNPPGKVVQAMLSPSSHNSRKYMIELHCSNLRP